MQFSDRLKSALNAVSQDVAADLEEPYRSNPEAVAEISMDAGRLGLSGFNMEQDEVRALIDIYGYNEVLKEAANHVSVW